MATVHSELAVPNSNGRNRDLEKSRSQPDPEAQFPYSGDRDSLAGPAAGRSASTSAQRREYYELALFFFLRSGSD